MKASELARRLGKELEGDADPELSGAAPLDTAGDADLSFVGHSKNAAQGRASNAGCLIAPMDFDNSCKAVIRDSVPRRLFAYALTFLYPDLTVPGIHPTAIIGEGSVIGEGSSIGPGCVIGRDVKLGPGCRLHPRVTIYDRVTIGRRAILHSGSVIGADGFGFAPDEQGRWNKFPQVGTVEIGDDVEIGANSCVDRAALGVTRIGNGCKFDNLVHIGHNCEIGNHVVIAAQTGLSGGVTVGDHAIIGGQVGIGDKARIEAHAVLGSGCGVLTSKIVRAGEPVWGTPARPLKKYLATLAAMSRLARRS
jgi:UDP-3-O-[3-hydroxymyristoyl] glucosamine N-acyltransferase